MAGRSTALQQYVNALDRIERVLDDETLPLKVRQDAYAWMVETYSPTLAPAQAEPSPEQAER